MPNLALEGVRAVTPLTQGARDLSWLRPRHVDHGAPLSEQLYDQLTAEEQLENLEQDKKSPLWRRTLVHAGIGAGLGGLLAGGKTLIGSHGNWAAVPVGAGIGAVSGAVLGAAFTGAKELLAGLLRRNAKRTIRESSPTAKLVMRSPRFRSHVKDHALSGWHPWYGAELGLYAGALGTAAHDWMTGTPVSWKRPLIGGGIGALLGGTAGYLLSEYRRKKLLHRIRDIFGRRDRERTRAESAAVSQATGELAQTGVIPETAGMFPKQAAGIRPITVLSRLMRPTVAVPQRSWSSVMRGIPTRLRRRGPADIVAEAASRRARGDTSVPTGWHGPMESTLPYNPRQAYTQERAANQVVEKLWRALEARNLRGTPSIEANPATAIRLPSRFAIQVAGPRLARQRRAALSDRLAKQERGTALRAAGAGSATLAALLAASGGQREAALRPVLQAKTPGETSGAL